MADETPVQIGYLAAPGLGAGLGFRAAGFSGSRFRVEVYKAYGRYVTSFAMMTRNRFFASGPDLLLTGARVGLTTTLWGFCLRHARPYLSGTAEKT